MANELTVSVLPPAGAVFVIVNFEISWFVDGVFMPFDIAFATATAASWYSMKLDCAFDVTETLVPASNPCEE
jgi:hypothetical protein